MLLLFLLRDISMSREYAGICGISEPELPSCFESEIQAMAIDLGISEDQAVAEMRRRYNGYHFSEASEGVYNPFSVLNALQAKGFELKLLTEGVKVNEESVTNYRLDRGSPVPLLYQSGYLTIKAYDRTSRLYTLGYPNEEVEYGFLNELLPFYSPWVKEDQGFFVYQFIEDLQNNDVNAFMNRLRAFFADIPYELNDKTERHYQTLFYLVFRLMGQFAQAEAAGRSDREMGAPQTP
ncbi:MAG: AAA family ATPase [Treponema sp.]|jgi:hypothetical protein|nr:AAA family ATPase [Treponema sp.]